MQSLWVSPAVLCTRLFRPTVWTVCGEGVVVASLQRFTLARLQYAGVLVVKEQCVSCQESWDLRFICVSWDPKFGVVNFLGVASLLWFGKATSFNTDQDQDTSWLC